MVHKLLKKLCSQICTCEKYIVYPFVPVSFFLVTLDTTFTVFSSVWLHTGRTHAVFIWMNACIHATVSRFSFSFFTCGCVYAVVLYYTPSWRADYTRLMKKQVGLLRRTNLEITRKSLIVVKKITRGAETVSDDNRKVLLSNLYFEYQVNEKIGRIFFAVESITLIFNLKKDLKLL